MSNKFLPTILCLLIVFSSISFGQELLDKKILSHMPEVTIQGQTLYADFNNDGNTDVVYYNYSAVYYCQSYLDEFSSPLLISEDYGYPNKMIAFDVDSDGDLDLIGARGHLLEWHENIAGYFEPVQDLYETNEFEVDSYYMNSYNEVFDIVAIDIDGDMVEELITHQLDGMFIHFINEEEPFLQSIQINDVMGGYWPYEAYATYDYDICGFSMQEIWTGGLVAEDLNDDGLKDLVFLSYEGGSYENEHVPSEHINVQYYLGEGEFSELISISQSINFELAVL